MTELPPPGAPAGWYPDAEPGRVRWWDGARWTAQTRAAAASSGEDEAGDSAPAPTAHGVTTSPSDSAADRPLVVRGTTGFVELTEYALLYRPKADRPPLQVIALDAVTAVVVSRTGDTFDIVVEGARARQRPSLFSETSVRRSTQTSPAEWERFLRALREATAR